MPGPEHSDGTDGSERVPTRRTFLQLVGVSGAAGLAGCQVEVDGTTDEDRRHGDEIEEGETEHVPLEEVPVEYHRMAAQHVEEKSGTEAAPTWDAARLGGVVRALHRPDVEGVAYYEFEVDPDGFVIVSTGDHDFPIPNWGFDRQSVGRILERRAWEDGEDVGRFYKLDSLYYVAESPDGRKVADQGDEIFRIEGIPPNALDGDLEQFDGFAKAGPAEPVEDDREVDEIEHVVLDEHIPEVTEAIEYEGWSSWEELLDGYADNYGVFIEALRRDAADSWEATEAGWENGRPVTAETDNVEVLLFPEAEYHVDGDGKELVRVGRLDREGGSPALEITVVDQPEENVGFSVGIEYGNGITEERRFFLTDGPRVRRSVASVGTGDSFDAPRAEATSAVVGGVLNSVDVTRERAGWKTDQCWYDQFEYKGCPVGCGPVAWGMLFGWANNKAHEDDPYWGSPWRGGLYRVDGGTSPSTAIEAPRYMDDDDIEGVKNMIRELRDHCQTFCVPGSQAATYPATMFLAFLYFINRTNTNLWTDFNGLGIPRSRLTAAVASSIGDRGTPAIIGTGWLSHYPLAYIYQKEVEERRFWFDKVDEYFFVNQGWGKDNNGNVIREWVSASTWFAGEIFP